ncbi:hypothetical protein, partial [Mycobacterium tuberculosis]
GRPTPAITPKRTGTPHGHPTPTVEAYWRSRRFDLGDYRISS